MLRGSTHYCAIAPHSGFSGVSPDGNCAYVHWILFTSIPTPGQSNEPSELRGSLSPTTQHRCPALLNFSDLADTDDLTPYSLGRSFFQSIIPNFILIFQIHSIYTPVDLIQLEVSHYFQFKRANYDQITVSIMSPFTWYRPIYTQ